LPPPPEGNCAKAGVRLAQKRRMRKFFIAVAL